MNDEAMDVSEGVEETVEQDKGTIIFSSASLYDVDVKDIFRSVLADLAGSYISSVEKERNGIPDEFVFIASIDLDGIHLCVQIEITKKTLVEDLTNAFIRKYYDECLTTDLPHFVHLCEKGLMVQMRM